MIVIREVAGICCSAEPCLAFARHEARHGFAGQQIPLRCSVVSVERARKTKKLKCVRIYRIGVALSRKR